MSDSIIEQLQKTAEKAMKSYTVAEGMQHLAKAFSLFSQEAARLKGSYESLQKDFDAVNKQLEGVSLYLTTLLKNISQGVLFINQSKVITIYNTSAQNILQIEEEKLLFKSYEYFFPDDYFGFSIQNSLTYGLSQKTSYITLTNHKKEKLEIEISTNYVHEGPKEHQGIVLMLQDITEKQQLQLIASRNERLKELGEITASVAHEIKNPIGGIRGYAMLLYRDLEKHPEMQEMAEQIIEGTKSLEKLVTTILQFSRPVQICLKSVDLIRLIRKLCKHIKVDPSCPNHIRVQTHIFHESLIAPIDPDALYAALLNLVMNGYQSMPNGGIITISVLKRDVSCVITISDTGCGIAEKDGDKIFSPFFTTKSKGNGLGLSETQKIIQAHGGRIDFHSRPLKGTTFNITLPLKR